jgi:hypothetical protein
VDDDVRDTNLRLLSSKLFGEAGHLEKVSEQEVTERVKLAPKGYCHLRVHETCVDRHSCSQTGQLGRVSQVIMVPSKGTDRFQRPLHKTVLEACEEDVGVSIVDVPFDHPSHALYSRFSTTPVML